MTFQTSTPKFSLTESFMTDMSALSILIMSIFRTFSFMRGKIMLNIYLPLSVNSNTKVCVVPHASAFTNERNKVLSKMYFLKKRNGIWACDNMPVSEKETSRSM